MPSREQTQLAIPGNLITTVQDLLNRIRYLERRNMAPQNLSELTSLMGTFRAGQLILGNGEPAENPSTLTGIALGEPGWTRDERVYGIIGERNGVLQFGISAEDGAAYFGRGAITANEDGLFINDAGDAIIFSDTNTGSYVITSLRVVNGYPSYEIRVLNVYSETNLISNGDFATGDFTGWIETDPSSKLSVTTIEDEFAFTIAPSASFSTTYLTQALVGYPIGFNFRGMVVTFKARATHANNQVKVGTSTTQQTFAIPGSNEWVNMVAVVTGTVTDLRIGGSTGPTSTVYIKDIVVRILEENPEQYFLMNPIQTYIRGDVYISDTFAVHPKSIPGTSRFASGAHIFGAFFLDGIENSTASGIHNDYWAVDPEGISVYRFNPSAALTLTGWRLGEPSPPVGGLYNGKVIAILNVHTSNTITLVNESASSTAESRFSLGADLVIPAGGMVSLWHDGTTNRWRLRSVNHIVAQYLITQAVTGLLELKGLTDCSSNPNYPVASKGDAYIVSVSGKIGGASGKSVDVGDWYIATADNAGGAEASVGTSWGVVEHNLTGALLAANNLSDLTDAAAARSNLGLVIGTQIRERLTATRTYYVRTDGNDSNTGLVNNAGGAFLTIQKAVDIASGLDNNSFDITIQLADGTYTTANGIILKAGVGSGKIIIVGNEGTPANVVVTTTAASVAGFFYNQHGTIYSIRGMKLTATNGVAHLDVWSNASLEFQNLDFGATVSFHLRVLDGATVQATGNYSISGGAQAHWRPAAGSIIRVQSRTITLTGTPNFTTAFVQCDFSASVIANGLTFSGGSTGSRYSAVANATINTAGGGANYFPGNSAGTTATGGQYI